MTARVTWLLPVKNGMPYISETLKSVAEQTFDDAEIIAWDNGSTDGTIEELERWIPSRIPGHIVSDNPLGLGASLAAMVEMAESELCARIDADDIALPQRLERQVTLLEQQPGIGLCGCNVKKIDEQGNPLGDDPFYPLSDAELRWRVRFANSFVHPSIVFRRESALAAGNYRDIMPGQDVDLWMRMIPHCQFANLEERLLLARERPDRVGKIHKKAGRELYQGLMERYAEQLFPDSHQEEITRLKTILVTDLEATVNLSDLSLLRKIASRAAQKLGKNQSYFYDNDYYSWQRSSLSTRYLKKFVAIRLLHALWKKIRFT